MTEPQDPFAVKAHLFRSVADRIVGDVARRQALGAKLLPFHHDFLDNLLVGIRSHDLVLLGAWSGIGKTQKATQLAMATAASGHRVAYIALEAEENEIEQRMKFQILARMASAASAPDFDSLNYAEWSLGRCEAITSPFDAAADREIRTHYGGMKTLYSPKDFSVDDLHQTVLAIQDQVDLVVLDHMHYVDVDDDNENRGYKRLTKTIRNLALSTGKPVLVVVHLRKKDRTGKVLAPTLDDVHGSSDITKICTRAIMLSPAYVVTPDKWYLSPTFVHVAKDRVVGMTPYAAVCQFDRRLQKYLDGYRLGRLSPASDRWDPVMASDLPRWAKGAERVYPAQGTV